MEINVIVTGATGMVGEGVVMECLNNPSIKQVLLVNRKPSNIKHQKLKECLITDFLNPEGFDEQLKGYDACFFCAGISSIGMSEEKYKVITYDTTLRFAEKLLSLNNNLTFCYISGSQTDSSEKGKIMWARVKGKTENDLMKLAFKKVYNFRPGLMNPTPGQKNIKTVFKIINSLYPLFKLLMPSQVITLSELGRAMINSVIKGYSKQILEVKDIQALAQG